MHLGGCVPELARATLREFGGKIKPALAALGVEQVGGSLRADLVLGIDGGGTQTVVTPPPSTD